MSNRPSGILTEADREFLRAGGEYYTGENARQNRYQRRRDIRERITQSILDFQDIASLVDENLRKQVFSEPEKTGATSKDEFRAAVNSLIYWLYLGHKDQDKLFLEVIKDPIKRAERDYHAKQYGELVDVEVICEMDVSERGDALARYARAIESESPVPAEFIHQLPTLSGFAVDVEDVDVVRVTPAEGTRSRPIDRSIYSMIVREYIDPELTVEVIGDVQRRGDNTHVE